jgi:hypothetical protein
VGVTQLPDGQRWKPGAVWDPSEQVANMVGSELGRKTPLGSEKVTARGQTQPMSCVEITDRMAILLHHLTSWPLSDEDISRLRCTPDWLQARAWGWVMESGELTGIGCRVGFDGSLGRRALWPVRARSGSHRSAAPRFSC